MRRSLMTASRKEYHTKKTSRKMRPTIGTLSGFVTMRRKFGSNEPRKKNSPRNANNAYPKFLCDTCSRFQMTTPSPPTASRKNTRGSAMRFAMLFRKPMSLPASLEWSGNPAVLAHAPEMHRHEHGDHEGQPDAVQDVEPEERPFTDK